MERIMFSYVVTSALLVLCSSQSNIRAILEGGQYRELSQLKDLMRNSDLMNSLGAQNGQNTQNGKYTFFAPSNEAFGNMSQQARARVLVNTVDARKDLENIFKYHTVYSMQGQTFTTSNMGDLRTSTNAAGPKYLFFRQQGMNYYVNGARITTKDIPASNGMVHIIDRFLYDTPHLGSALKYVYDQAQSTSDETSTSEFVQLLNEYNKHYQDATVVMDTKEKVTVFIPNDKSIRRNQKLKEKLRDVRNNPTLLKKVIEAHVISEAVYFSPLLNNEFQANTIDRGLVKANTLGSNVYVSTNCVQGQIVKANVTVQNGVVHIVDAVLGLLYNDLNGQVSGDPQLATLAVHISNSPQEIKDLLISEEVQSMSSFEQDRNNRRTLFAPVNSAFDKIRDMVDLSKSEMVEEVLRMHILRNERVHTSAMLNNTKKRTMLENVDIEFIRYGTENPELYVQVNYVRSRIIRSDVCTRNGIIHYVEQVLGIPYATALEEITTNPHTSQMSHAISQAGMTDMFSEKTSRMTIFAVNNSVFDQLRNTESGRELFESKNIDVLQRVFYRQVIPDKEVYLNGTLNEGNTTYTSRWGQIVINKYGNDYRVMAGSLTARVLWPNIRVTNGVMHILDKILFNPDRKSSEWTGVRPKDSAAHAMSPALPLFLLTCLLAMLL